MASEHARVKYTIFKDDMLDSEVSKEQRSWRCNVTVVAE